MSFNWIPKFSKNNGFFSQNLEFISIINLHLSIEISRQIHFENWVIKEIYFYKYISKSPLPSIKQKENNILSDMNILIIDSILF